MRIFYIFFKISKLKPIFSNFPCRHELTRYLKGSHQWSPTLVCLWWTPNYRDKDIHLACMQIKVTVRLLTISMPIVLCSMTHPCITIYNVRHKAEVQEIVMKKAYLPKISSFNKSFPVGHDRKKPIILVE